MRYFPWKVVLVSFSFLVLLIFSFIDGTKMDFWKIFGGVDQSLCSISQSFQVQELETFMFLQF